VNWITGMTRTGKTWRMPLPDGRGSEWIDATDRRIDRLVYALHGLTDDEIRIVEEATQG